MPYTLTQFGTVTLPPYEGSHPIGDGPVQTSIIGLPYGVYDAQGSEISPRRTWSLSVSGEIVSDTAANFRTTVNQLLALIGTKAKLYRTWDDATVEWVWARLVNASGSRETGKILWQGFDLDFQILSQNWNANSQTSTTGTINTPGDTLVVTNNGNAPVRDAVVTVSNPSGGSLDVSSFTLTVSGQVEWSYVGLLSPGDSVVIDTGARSVLRNGADDYINFSIGASHAISEWLRLSPGNTTLTVNHAGVGGSLSSGSLTGILGPPTYSGTITVAVGALDLQVDFYDQWR